MNTDQLKSIIGPVIESQVVKHRYGDAALHENGFISADPCYIEPDTKPDIRDAIRAAYPWTGYEYGMHQSKWCPFTYNGATCYYKDYSDGVGAFGLNVDSGCIVACPVSVISESVLNKFNNHNKLV